MKRVLCLIGGVLLTVFSLLTFLEFFLAWNGTDVMVLWNANNFRTDAMLSYPLTEWFLRAPFLKEIAFEEMLICFLGETDQWGYPSGILAFTREDWFQ